MTAREQAEQAMQSMLAGALDSNILDDQFMQLRNLQDDSNPDFVKDLIELYYVDAAGKIEGIQELLGKPEVDFKQIDQIVHQFKGSSASFGAAAMAENCIKLRDACSNHDVESCKQYCEALRYSFGVLQDTLNKFLILEKQMH